MHPLDMRVSLTSLYFANQQELCRTTLLKQHDDREKEKRSDNVIQQWLEEKQKKHKEQERKERQLERMKRHEKEQASRRVSRDVTGV